MENNIEVGEYVRLVRNQGINKVIDIEDVMGINEKKVKLIAGRLNRGNETLYWKYEQKIQEQLGDYVIVENAGGYDLVQISGVVETTAEKAGYFSKTKYENMKSVIGVISRGIIEIETEKARKIEV